MANGFDGHGSIERIMAMEQERPASRAAGRMADNGKALRDPCRFATRIDKSTQIVETVGGDYSGGGQFPEGAFDLGFELGSALAAFRIAGFHPLRQLGEEACSTFAQNRIKLPGFGT